MQQEQSKLSDETTPGIPCEIQIRKSGKYNYKFAKLLDEKFNALDNGDEVIVLTISEHKDLLKQSNISENSTNENKLIEDLKNKILKQKQTIVDLKKNINHEKDADEKQLNDSAIGNNEKELKETIKKQQTHIDELTQKYQSLLPSKENIPQKEHYMEIDALKDKIRTLEKDIKTKDAEIETKLEKKKSDLLIENTNEKAQMLVAYNQELNKIKMQYNNLAKDYNNLLNGVESLTRINTLMNGKHNEIKKDKEQVPMLEITSEPSNKTVLEYVPKD